MLGNNSWLALVSEVCHLGSTRILEFAADLRTLRASASRACAWVRWLEKTPLQRRQGHVLPALTSAQKAASRLFAALANVQLARRVPIALVGAPCRPSP